MREILTCKDRKREVSMCNDKFLKYTKSSGEFFANKIPLEFATNGILRRTRKMSYGTSWGRTSRERWWRRSLSRFSLRLALVLLHGTATAYSQGSERAISPFSEEGGLDVPRSPRIHIIQCTYVWTAHCLRSLICRLARCPLLVLSDGSIISIYLEVAVRVIFFPLCR